MKVNRNGSVVTLSVGTQKMKELEGTNLDQIPPDEDLTKLKVTPISSAFMRFTAANLTKPWSPKLSTPLPPSMQGCMSEINC